MGTLTSFYIRAGGDPITSIIRKKFPEATIAPGPDFTGFALPNDDGEPPAAELAALSAEFATDVIWLGFQSVVDAFQFHHWRAGAPLRSLVFGCHGDERTWDRAEGEAEEWERAAFFDPEVLRDLLEEEWTEEQKREFQRIWQGRELHPGRTQPSIDARESARKAADHYNFPGWS
jgi:hypothetical protein